MKIRLRYFFPVLFSLQFINSIAQEIPATTEQALENLADADQSEPEDDSYILQLEQFRKNPVNLNIASVDELKELRILSDMQIVHLINYRNLLGKFISVYELQAIPLWDIVTIKKLLPFITVDISIAVPEEFGKRFRGGEHSLLFRVSELVEKQEGFESSAPGTMYRGSRQKLFFRYRYVFRNLFQFGCLGDKDAGEQFFKGAQRRGFDFYSFHLFAKRMGIVQALALGDFTVNLGQGLIQWQSLAFKKNAAPINVKRQSTVLKPYNSAGEFYFHRGAGITIRKGRIEATAFGSLRKLSTNIVNDTIRKENVVSSVLSGGYHRTDAENKDKNNLIQKAVGLNMNWRNRRNHIGVNAVYYNFSLPLQKKDEPYNYYAISGRSWCNLSIDYSYTYKNLHFFGEAAADKNFNKAFINGLLLSVDPQVDISFVQRTISASYQAMYGNAFTENTNPSNETGYYTGISIRPLSTWRVDVYADIFIFPWLKYRADAPGSGKDFLVQLNHSPNKQVEIYTRFRYESRTTNQTGNTGITNNLVNIIRQIWQTQVNYQFNRVIELRNRIALTWYREKQDAAKQTGFLAYLDFIYKPMKKDYSAVIRLEYFETGGYDSRIYAYENDVLYSNSIPAAFGKAFRYYFNLKYNINKKISSWVRWSQTIYSDQNIIGSGADAIAGNKRSDIKFQVLYTF